jgi:hypothetical protein
VVLLCLFGYSLSLLLLSFLATSLAEEPVALEKIKVFLQFAALWFIEGEF